MNTDNLNLFADIALASNTPKANVERVTDKKAYSRIQLVAPFYRLGFTSIDLINADYPQNMINSMTLLEKGSGIRIANPYNLVNYNQLEWYTTTSPHVICPNCKGAFTLTSKNKIRQHSCHYYKMNGPPSISKNSKKRVVVARPVQPVLIAKPAQ